MLSILAPTAQWAQEQFGLAPLGDLRRTKRLVKITTKLAASPGGTLPQAFPEWAELKAAYRFFSQPQMTPAKIQSVHLENTLSRCRQPGEHLIIEDTTLLDYSASAAALDLGIIGNGHGRGFELHSALAVRVEGWTLEQKPEGMVVGLLGQQCDCPTPRPPGETEAQRWQRARKSRRWAAALEAIGSPPTDCRWIYLADREADFYEPIQVCQRRGIDFVIRSRCNRRLADEAGHLWEKLSQQPMLGQSTVELRARPGQAARTAIVELRARQVDLDGPWRPGGWQPELRGLWVVEVREVNAPESVKEPLHWILLTSLPCSSLAEVLRVVGRYSARWWIEEYHKALKTGAGAEESQLEQGYRLESLIAVLAIVAVRVLATKFLARSRPESFEAVQDFSPTALTILETKLGKPRGGWTNQKLLTAIARLGGFLARKHDGQPGWQTIWRGWQRLVWMSDGVETLTNTKLKCG
jgi:hypothetical protein